MPGRSSACAASGTDGPGPPTSARRPLDCVHLPDYEGLTDDPPARRRAPQGRYPTETLPNYLIGIGVIGLTTTSAVAGLLLVRRAVSFEVLQANHEVAAAKFQVMGTLYAVLLAFAVVIVWQQFQSAAAIVAHEAAKLANLFHDAAEYPEADRVRFRRQLLAYADAVVTEEWDAMASGGESERAREEYNELWDIYREIRPRNLSDLATANETLRRMNELGENRLERLLHSSASIHPALWFALITVGGLIIGFSYFFGTESLTSQVLMTTFFSGTLGLILFIIIVLSHPFKGYGRVSPEPFVHLLVRLRALTP